MKEAQKHICNRPCNSLTTKMICDYKWHVERYLTMSDACMNCPFNLTHCNLPNCIAANGLRRPITVINRALPGPGIFVCEGDLIRVQVENWLPESESTTIHWHGMLQKGTQYMDGADMVTQCPINSLEKFTYE